MGLPVVLFGLGLGAQAVGNQQALDAQTDAVKRSINQQRAFDARKEQLTTDFIGQSDPTQFMGIPQQAGYISQMNKGSGNLASALRKSAARAGTGSRSSAASRASMHTANNQSLADALRANRVIAQRMGMQEGALDQQQRRGQYATDAGLINKEAQTMAGLLPINLQAAQHEGSGLRMLGQLAMMGGRAGLGV